MAKANVTAIKPQEVQPALANTDAMHVDDLPGLIKCASDKFSELAVLFDAIRSRLDSDVSDLYRLASLGHDVADDFANQTDCWREDLEKNGVRQ